jgi:LPS sulfotransferase NodH
VVIARSRTGSNLLITLLNSHKNIIAKGAMFSRLNGRSTKDILDSAFPVKSLESCVGFKLFYYHPNDSDDKSIWDVLMKDKSIKIIHLTRANLLRVHISRLIANKTDKWTTDSKDNNTKNKKVVVNIKEMIDDIEVTKHHMDQVERMFPEHEIFELTYEDLIDKQDAVLKQIQLFLGVKVQTLNSYMKRQNPENIEDLVINYKEVSSTMMKLGLDEMVNNF